MFERGPASCWNKATWSPPGVPNAACSFVSGKDRYRDDLHVAGVRPMEMRRAHDRRGHMSISTTLRRRT